MELDWDGAQGRFWVDQQEHQDAVLAGFVPLLLEAGGVGEGDAVLDVGCGCGATSRAAAHAVGDGHVLGVDISGPMLTHARSLAAAEGLRNIEFVDADAQTHAFAPGSVDVAISRFGVMFFADPPAAFANIAAALRPGGRLAFLCWQPAKLNPHISLPMRAVVTAFPDAMPKGAPQPPFSMADPDEVTALLTGAGFGDIKCTPVEGLLRVGADADEVLARFLTQPMAKALLSHRDLAQVDAVVEEIRAQLNRHQRDDGVHLGSAAWSVTARR
ncbi:class I SAM-dependent methyltransferase [Speluncibacter jeojiensis]|uniref:Class I SAM-dependent methyltransferase n=1 Tax=Speluncibacter jeojiensis TaxID=2710754 RepID=A0A9X4M8Q4_9ACTN|nr:class I SAM-dependent methyltransferase [Corynebacteriales bacterium D3-21]